MPSSFSRFLSEEELLKVRDLYLQSLEEDEDEGQEEDDAPEHGESPSAGRDEDGGGGPRLPSGSPQA